LGQQINTEGEQQQQSTAGLEIQHKMQGEIQDQDWGESRWEEIVLHPRVGQEQMGESMGCRRTHLKQHSRDKQRAGRWQNKPQTAGMRANIKSFCQVAENIHAKLIPTEEQIRAAMRKEVIAVESWAVEGDGFRATAEEIHASRTREEEMVQELILQWQKGAHGYIPEIKENDILQLGCENMNSLSLYNPKGSNMRKLINIHQKYQTDGGCILKHGINFRMSSNGNRPNDLFFWHKGQQSLGSLQRT
jgi:hypothetical protein